MVSAAAAVAVAVAVAPTKTNSSNTKYGMFEGFIQAADGKDQLWRSEKFAWRVRVRPLDEVSSKAPTNGEQPLTATSMSVSVSVALLDEALEVSKDTEGRLMVFDATSVNFPVGQLDDPDFNPEAILEKAILDRIQAAELQLEGRARIEAALSSWKRDTF
ncbi:hypothetical protein ACIGGE_10665 [Qipengyuania sp. NPDC077410]|uniref:hypothetical protein n=1 Tax=Qipengyuania sp. NPDC077410 TaxID=3364496 RepID=UPI0037C65BA7